MKKGLFIFFLLLMIHSYELRALDYSSQSQLAKAKPHKSKRIFSKERFVQDGLVFEIKEAEIYLRGSGLEAFHDLEESSFDDTFPSACLAIRYHILNENQTKKLSMEERVDFSLQDEYDNNYSLLTKPDDYPKLTKSYEAGFPSLYPGQSFEEVIFFEAPILESRFLFLTIKAKGLGLNDDVIVKIPTQGIVGFDQLMVSKKEDKHSEERKPETETPKIGPLKIVSPAPGAAFTPGEVVHIEVKIPEDSAAPNHLYVVVPTYILEDHQLAFQYDLRIPQDTMGSLAVIVIGHWETPQGEEILSDSIVLNIGVPALAK